ncbi:uncharacterized protein LOC125298505 isoform X2 [Alosa alosa]|uniref:uncharacterized protein LOC125298505 isoform X2 n=1 Tax=Alosa alosa TaxID=278164 RepID=UPI0020155532|nr:uncharacterized protein LOC125298505 isoform X2 [Alosa alosa]
MATFGTIGEFVEGDEDWTEYEERLGHFFAANRIAEEARKRSVLQSVCGAKTYKLMRNLATPKKPGEIDYTELVKLVGNHHNPKPSVIVQRFKLHSHFRKSGQSVANFVAELWQLSEHCDYKDVLDDMLRDRLVCGINNDAIQRRLLGETPPLKKALEISFGMEMAANNAKDIQKGQAGSQSVAVHHVNREAAKSGSSTHTSRQAQAHTHHVKEDDGEAACAFNVFAVDTDEGPPMPYYATVTVEGQDIKFEVEVISEETYRRTWGHKPPPIKPSNLKLRTYTDTLIEKLRCLLADAGITTDPPASPSPSSSS